MANADRITELYKGEIWDERAQRVARDRVDWLVGQARGAVLDVGCSQGVASILCARRGLRTVGVDVETDRIEYALADRSREPDVVRGLVAFRVADARRLDLPDASFDSVLLGEVVEHHVDASPVLAEVARVLRPSGALALTTPFGYFPHHDHRATFFVGSLLDLLAPYVSVDAVDVVDGYLRALCRPGAMSRDRQRELLAALQPVVEQEFTRTQRELREARSRTSELTARLGALEPQLAALPQQRDQLGEVVERLRGLEEHTARLVGVNARLDEAERELREVQEAAGAAEREHEGTVAALRRKVHEAEDRWRGAEERLQRRTDELNGATGRLAAANRRLRHQTYRTQYVTWQLRSSFNRRWWRLGQALWKVGESPARFLELPGDLVRAMRRHPPPKPPRRPGRRPSARTRGRVAQTAGTSGPVRPAMPEIPAIILPDGPVVRPDLTVAVILDEFSAMAFRYEWRQVEPGPGDWREVMERERPAMLFVESAWHGNGDRWEHHMTARSGPSPELRELVSWCRENNIATVFWNKEDPPSFDTFVAAAKLFDWVFTVDGDCVPRYRETVGHDRIGVLPFGAQPRVHNPVSVPGGRRHPVAFAGMYFAHRHTERAEQMRAVLSPAREFGLHIFSRQLGGEQRYQFPAEYDRHVVGSLPYGRMLAAYKSYKVFLNVNSVLDSPTMCARRVFELSACSTPVLSGYSRAIEATFGDLVPLARTAAETRTRLTTMVASPQLRDRNAHLALREVLARHTYGHRVETVLDAVGLASAGRTPTVSVIVATNRPEQFTHVIAQVARQRWRPLQLVLVLHGVDTDPGDVYEKASASGVDDVVVLSVDRSETLGACLNQAIDVADGEFIAKMDDDDIYGEHYLSDLVPAFSYTDAGIVGKRAFHVYLSSVGATVLRSPAREHTYVDMVLGATMVGRADLLRELRFEDVSRGEDTRLQHLATRSGVRIYSADRYSFIYVRKANPHAHTWHVSDSEILQSGRLEFYGWPEEHVLI